jgi:hypothetical protein
MKKLLGYIMFFSPAIALIALFTWSIGFQFILYLSVAIIVVIGSVTLMIKGDELINK